MSNPQIKLQDWPLGKLNWKIIIFMDTCTFDEIPSINHSFTDKKKASAVYINYIWIDTKKLEKKF